MQQPDYQLDRGAGEADQRLGLLERLEDPGSVACLEALGVMSGWHCLEVGAGRGSIARWLAARVGTAGRVVALDADTRLLEPLGAAGVEVRRADIARDALERESYDLVHARHLLVHLPEREAVLRKLGAAVRPGGSILIEELDASTDGPDPGAPEPARQLYRQVVGAIYEHLQSAGLDPYFGARVPGLLRAAGFGSLRSEGRLRTFFGGPDQPGSPHTAAFAQLAETVIASGRVTRERFEAFLGLARDPTFAWREGLTVATWGKK